MQEGTPIIIKKKKVHGHGHHGGAWKVAFADFVTAMMAFFMVMWIMGMSQETKELIQGYFRDPVGFMANPPKTNVNVGPDGGPMRTPQGQEGAADRERDEVKIMEAMDEQLRGALSDDPTLKELGRQKAIETKVTPDGVVVELAETETNSEVFFTLGSSQVRPQARAVLARLAPILAGTKRPIVVDGHTDSLPLPNPDFDNFDLSSARASAVRRLLREGGVPEGQFLAVRGFGSTQPRRPEDPAHFSNRRVTILLPYSFSTQSVGGLPGDVERATIEGKFRMPGQVTPRRVDLRREGLGRRDALGM